MRTLSIALLALILSAPASAEQARFHVEKGKSIWHFEVAWRDAAGEFHEINYALSARTVKQDLDQPLRFVPADASRYVAEQVNRWSAGQRGVAIEATPNGQGGVDLSATARDAEKLRAAMDEAQRVRDEATERYLTDNGFTTLDGKVIPDHALHVVEYADNLSPLVTALGGPTEDPRDYGAVALSFVQSIPYEQRAKVSDRYRRPLSVLGRNIGDCDSKTVLYLALMREAYPELPLALVYVRGHAYGALGMEAEKGDYSFREEGRSWVGVEPVGPAVVGVGEVGKTSRRRSRFGRRTLRVVEG